MFNLVLAGEVRLQRGFVAVAAPDPLLRLQLAPDLRELVQVTAKERVGRKITRVREKTWR